MSNYAKARVELDRTTGSLLARDRIVLDEAERGTVLTSPAVPDIRRRSEEQPPGR
jgi:hypothetical protein